jgi:hypothetical protein
MMSDMSDESDLTAEELMDMLDRGAPVRIVQGPSQSANTVLGTLDLQLTPHWPEVSYDTKQLTLTQ